MSKQRRPSGPPSSAPPANDGNVGIDAVLRELLEIWPTLDDDDRETLISIARRLAFPRALI
jgi:hypothetical protein